MKKFSFIVRKKEVLVNLLYVFISLFITLVMFRGGNILGGGEVGAAFYSPYRIFEMIKYSWSNVHLGITSGLMPASAPFFGLLGILQNIGIPPVLLQAIFFFFVIMLTQVSMFYFSKALFPRLGVVTWFLAGSFYMFNPYATLNIWNRFLPNTMLFYALIPLSTLIFIKGAEKKDYVYAIILSLVTAFGSYAFSAPAQTLIFWGILFITAVYKYTHSSDKKFIVKYFFLLIIFWIFTNFWWISQQFSFVGSSTYSTSTQQFFSNAGNLSTFVTLSKSLGQFQDLLIFSHGRISHEILNYPYNWPRIYSSVIYTIFAWLVLIVTLFFTFKHIKRKHLSYLMLLYVIGIFLSKGNLPPFGFIFYKAFEKFFFLQFFRNPFEKFGYLTAFSFSLIFAFGFTKLFSILSSKKVKILLNVLVFGFIFLLNGFPFFTGLVFTSDLFPSNDPKTGIQVKIPQSYNDTNAFLQSLCTNCRYIAMPLGLGEGIYYNWEKGYVGLEQSGFLLQNPGISHNTTFPYYGEISSQIEKLFLTQNRFDKISKLLNAPFVLVRGDVDFMRSKMRNPEFILQRANQFESTGVLDYLRTYDDISIYKFKDSADYQKIYSASGFSLTTKSNAYDQIFYTNFKDNEVLYPMESNLSIPDKLKYNPSIVLKSDTYFESNDNNFLKYSEESYIFPYVQTLATSGKFPLIRLKEKFEGIMKYDLKERAYWDLLLLGKRLKEVQLSNAKSDFKAGKISLEYYTQELPKVLDKLTVLNTTFKKPDERIWYEEEIVKLFSSHLFLLTELESTGINTDSSVTNAKKLFINLTSTNNILPFWNDPDSELTKNQNILTYKVTVPIDGEYEIFLPITDFFPKGFIDTNTIPVQIDDKLEMLNYEVENSQISLGKRYFSKGAHEINVIEQALVNLADISEFTLEATTEAAVKEIPILGYSPFSDYKISFDYFIEYGSALNFSIQNDNDLIMKDTGYYYRKTLQPDFYFFGEKHFETSLNTYPLSNSATMVFQISPWNNCTAVFNKNKFKCNDLTVYSVYNKPTKIIVKNLKVYPKLPRTLYVVQENVDTKLDQPVLEYTMVNPTRYNVKVTGANNPFLLVFSESFDSRWRIKNKNTEKIVSDSKHILVNGYANAWWMDDLGNYETEIYYEPQSLLIKGYIISLSSSSLLVILLIVLKKRQKK